MKPTVSDWHACYNKSWTGIITPDSFRHPAKFSRALIRHIYEHAFDEGWLQAGSVVVDPFGGVALGALEAMRWGLTWVGVELELPFVGLGNQNLDLWHETYSSHLPNWGSAVLLQGDSRCLAQVITEARTCISSPPYAQSEQSRDGNFVLESTPVNPTQCKLSTRSYFPAEMNTLGQLGQMLNGDIAAAISSPPYVESLASDDPDKRGGFFRDPKRRDDKTLTAEYGDSVGQLGAMAAGKFDAAVSSPPYAESLQPETPEQTARKQARIAKSKHLHDGRKLEIPSPGKAALGGGYGTTDGQLSQESGDTFWLAARTIIEQVYTVLRPGGHAIWVTKAFVRKGQRIDFPGQWRELCEAVGFVTLHKHRAMLIEDCGAQYDLMGELHERKVARKSFFRRLHEKKYPHLSIDYEVILCMEKPDG